MNGKGYPNPCTQKVITVKLSTPYAEYEAEERKAKRAHVIDTVWTYLMMAGCVAIVVSLVVLAGAAL